MSSLGFLDDDALTLFFFTDHDADHLAYMISYNSTFYLRAVASVVGI